MGVKHELALTQLGRKTLRGGAVVELSEPAKTPWCLFPAAGKWAFRSILSEPRVPES